MSNACMPSESPLVRIHPAPWKVFVVHDHRASGASALALCREMFQEQIQQARFEAQWTRFEMLGGRDTLELAIEAALQADLVVIADDGRRSLPLEVLVWLRAWMHGRRLPGTLLLMSRPLPEPAAILRRKIAVCLQAASESGLTFWRRLEGEEETPPRNPPPLHLPGEAAACMAETGPVWNDPGERELQHAGCPVAAPAPRAGRRPGCLGEPSRLGDCPR